jgi:hypothetical protein
MVDDMTRASDALRLAAADANFRPLIPALSGCPTCGTVIMVAAPVLTTCLDCGVVAVVLDRTSVGATAAHDSFGGRCLKQRTALPHAERAMSWHTPRVGKDTGPHAPRLPLRLLPPPS